MMLEYLYEELDASARQEFEAALENCPECTEELAALRKTAGAYDNVVPLEVPGKLHADIMRAARLHADVLARQAVPWWKRVLSPPMMLASATVAAAALAAVFIAQPPATNDTPTQVNSSGIESVATATPETEEVRAESEMAPPTPTAPHGGYPHQLGIERGVGSAGTEPSAAAPSAEDSASARPSPDRDSDSELVNDEGRPVELAADYEQMIQPDLDVVTNGAFDLGRGRGGTAEREQEAQADGLAVDSNANRPSRTATTDSSNDTARIGGAIQGTGSADYEAPRNEATDRSEESLYGSLGADAEDDDWGEPTDRSPGMNSGFGLDDTVATGTDDISGNTASGWERTDSVAPSVPEGASQPEVAEAPAPEPDAMLLEEPEEATIAGAEQPMTQGSVAAAPAYGEDARAEADEVVAALEEEATEEDADLQDLEEENAHGAAELSFQRGLASYSSGDYEAAVSQLQASLSAGISGSSEAEAQYHLGAAYFRLGNYSRARTELTAFISDYPNHAYVEDAQQLVDEAREDQDANRRSRDNNEVMIDFADEAIPSGSR